MAEPPWAWPAKEALLKLPGVGLARCMVHVTVTGVCQRFEGASGYGASIAQAGDMCEAIATHGPITMQVKEEAP